MSESPVHVDVDGDIHPEPRRIGHKLFDLTVALAAITISLISLFVAIEHGRTERQLVAANSWPYLSAGTTNEDAEGAHRIIISITNAGVGPAKLETLELFYDEHPLASAQDLLRRCCSSSPPSPPSSWAGMNQYLFSVIRPGQTLELIGLPMTPENKTNWLRLNIARDHIHYRGCYCSVLDECWINDLVSLKPTPVKICPKPAVAYEGQDARPDPSAP